MRLRFGSSYWLKRSPDLSRITYPQHRGHLDVDVAIVGGGFTGCTVAYVLANAGLRVALFERGRVGRGSAVASTALLMQEPDRSFRELTRRYRSDAARTIWRLSRRAVRDLVRMLDGMNCGLRSVSSFHLAANPQSAHDLRREYRARRNAGLGGRLLDRQALHRAGLDAEAAIMTAGNAVVDPYRATHGLAMAAVGAGALVFERSDVIGVKGGRTSAVVTTTRGDVGCSWAVIATGFATPAFKPLRARFRMSSTYVIATRSASNIRNGRVPVGAYMFWDAAQPYHYFRWTDDRRILFGGGDRRVPRTKRARRKALAESAQQLRTTLAGLFPPAALLPVEMAWEGVFATTPDGLPYIGEHRRYPRHLFALGYGGNGMTFALLAAQMILRRCLARSRANDALFSFQRLR